MALADRGQRGQARGQDLATLADERRPTRFAGATAATTSLPPHHYIPDNTIVTASPTTHPRCHRIALPGMVVSEHAGAALSQRTWGVPALATYFHATFGWGILRVMQAFQFERPFASVLLGPLVALLWDPILRVARALVADATDVTLAPTIMGVTLLATLLTAPAIPTHTIPTDWLLFAAPALNQLYFGASMMQGETPLPPRTRYPTYDPPPLLAHAHMCSASSDARPLPRRRGRARPRSQGGHCGHLACLDPGICACGGCPHTVVQAEPRYWQDGRVVSESGGARLPRPCDQWPASLTYHLSSHPRIRAAGWTDFKSLRTTASSIQLTPAR